MENQKHKPNKGEKLRGWFDFIFGFKNKTGEVLDHWVAFLDNFTYSPQEFYEAVEKELAARKIPGMEISREEFTEGGLLSDKRIYLRLIRERLTVYTCAAPFGTGYFFSCRIVHVPVLLYLWHILAALVFFGIVGGLLVNPLGPVFAAIGAVALMFALAGVLRNATAAPESDVDTLLLKIPVVATIYESMFRSDTYYRQDTRLIYLLKVPEFVKGMAEDISAQKGAVLEQYQSASVVSELYQRVPPRKPDAEK